MSYRLIINGFTPPPPDEGGFTIGREKIWSENTKRTASAEMVGDIKAIKTTLDIKWSELSQEDLISLDEAVSVPFFETEYDDEKGVVQTKNFYAASMSYPRRVYRNNEAVYIDVSLNLVEK